MLRLRNEAIQAEVDAPVNVRRRRWLVRHRHGSQIKVADQLRKPFRVFGIDDFDGRAHALYHR
jgi:hypothetical protein